MYESGAFTVREIAEATGVSKSTLYRYLAHGVGKSESIEMMTAR